jgi:hypothetical protein
MNWDPVDWLTLAVAIFIGAIGVRILFDTPPSHVSVKVPICAEVVK